VAVKHLGKMIIVVLDFCSLGQVFGQSWPQDLIKRARLLDALLDEVCSASPSELIADADHVYPGKLRRHCASRT
jgi:hypothetical protein